MTTYSLSAAADGDIEAIVRISIELWGIARAARYVAELHQAFEMLNRFPDLGIDVGGLRDGYFSFHHASHTVYFKKVEPGILIVRVLHKKQQPQNVL
jgi:toxin ParE1/3/4